MLCPTQFQASASLPATGSLADRTRIAGEDWADSVPFDKTDQCPAAVDQGCEQGRVVRTILGLPRRDLSPSLRGHQCPDISPNSGIDLRRDDVIPRRSGSYEVGARDIEIAKRDPRTLGGVVHQRRVGHRYSMLHEAASNAGS